MALPAATGFTATIDSTTSTNVNLAWTRPSDVPAGANTIIKQSGTVIKTITDASITTYTVEDLTPGTESQFTVHFEISDDSEPVSATAVIPLPTVPATTAAGTLTGVNLSWQRPNNLPRDATTVIRRGSSAGIAVTIHESATTTNFVDRDNIQASQTYRYHFYFRFNNRESAAVYKDVTIS